MINFLGINWGNPQYIWLFPILFIAIFLLIFKFLKQVKVINYLVHKVHQKKFLLHYSYASKIIKVILSSLGLLFLFLALLGPMWSKQEQNIEQAGRDIFIALDVSRSMLAKDLKPNRLEFAKHKIKDLLKLIKTDRVGLILFSGSAFVQCPLTRDFPAFYMYLDQVDTETISSGTTALDQAIKVALASFKDSQINKNKLLVILTDGEDFSSNLNTIKEEVNQQNLHIFSIGIGTTQGAPIPIIDEDGKQSGHQLDKQGQVVMSKLNEGILRALSQQSGGYYVTATKDNNDLDIILNKIEYYEKEKFEDKKISNYILQYPYFVLVSFICFLLEWIL
ncbi:MAG: VWA domain-containing protein [Candidatus Babeliales bacterium]|nr:VWA domain-containing protein [Candidatus Babeliales bacterium]